MQAKSSQQWNGEGRNLGTKGRNLLAHPEIAERSIDEEGRALDKKGSDGVVESFHFKMLAPSQTTADGNDS
jgi:hypothetical protein